MQASSGGRPVMAPVAAPAPQPDAETAPRAAARPEAAPPAANITFEGFLRWLDEKRESILKRSIERFVHLISFEPGRISLRVAQGGSNELHKVIREKLVAMTGTPWLVALSNEGGAATIDEQKNALRRQKEGAAMELPLVRAAFETWPKARIIAVRDRDELIAPPDLAGEGAGGDMADAAQSPDAPPGARADADMDGNGE